VDSSSKHRLTPGALPERSQLAGALARFPAIRVLVAGDFILDSFVEGAVHRISPEAPIPVLHNQQARDALGGAGNVVANVAGLGGIAVPMGVVGEDAAGHRLLELLGNTTGGMIVEPGRVTPHKTRFSAQHQQILRVDSESVEPLGPLRRVQFLAAFAAELPAADIVVLSDYGKGALLDGMAAELIALGRAAGKIVVVDPKSRDFGHYAQATIITPNLKELSEALRRPHSSEPEIVAGARELIGAHGLGAVVVTRSEKGLSVVTADTAAHIPATARELFDVSGAGDTVVATLALALAAGLGLEGAGMIANTAAGIAVSKPGTAVVTGEELAVELLAAGPDSPAIADRAGAVRQVEAWRRDGMRVGFTNGCFDLLHAGHVTLLAAARSKCDRLVVGLNSDASVRRLKGEQRPINIETDRAIVLAALSSVDLVVIFGEDTPAELIEAIRPDVLVKGADYAIDQVVGAQFVAATGGETVLVELVAGKSTSEIIRRMTPGANQRGRAGERPQ